MSTVTSNDVTINYRSVGDGEDVVLIHGFGANHAFWHLSVILPLAREYRVTVYDLRGHGYSGMPSKGYTSADMAEDLHHLLDHLEISRAHLIGHSFGGVVALHYAALHTKRVNSLTILDSRIPALQPRNRSRDWPNWQKTKNKFEELGLFIPEDEPESGICLLEQLASPEWQRNRHKLVGSSLFIPFSKFGGGNKTAERWIELLRTTSARQDLTSLAGLTTDRLSTIRQPTLLIYGENSPAMPSFQALRKHLHDCRSVVIPGAGHFFLLTQPDLFITKATRFLEQAGRKERRKHERFSYRRPLALRENGSARIQATSVDVCRQGILLTCSRELGVGSEIEVTTAPDREGRRISVRGKVARSSVEDPEGDFRFGVELLSEGEGYIAWQDLLAFKT